MEDPDKVRPLLLHPDDSAGGLMPSEFVALRERMTAAEAIRAIRDGQPDGDSVYYLFVVDRLGRLSGVVSLRQLIMADPKTYLMQIMDPEVLSVPVGTDQEECARIMSRYDLLALPVVNGDNTLLGLVTFDDVMDVLEDQATEDMQGMGGAEPLERPDLDTNILTVVRKRIGSLLPLVASRLCVDPTVVSGPVMSTLVDATGLLIYFTIARLVLRL